MCEDRKKEFTFQCGLSTGVLETMDSVLFRGYSHVRARGVTHKRRASIPSKGWKVSFKRAFKKREKKKETNAWQKRKWEEGL